ncbi:hypothetical protein Btru_027022 [Bulinus truncatus]|nr:hypothetical protein Btru_027022 [Bulinus truncatus]
MSEDSDYTSDINYPVQHQHNTSAHQYRSHPDHPYRLRDDSRETIRYDDSFDQSFDQRSPDQQSPDRRSFDQYGDEDYDRGEHPGYSRGDHRGGYSRDYSYDHDQAYYPSEGHYHHGRSESDSDCLFYNSRPNSRPQSFIHDSPANSHVSSSNISPQSTKESSFDTFEKSDSDAHRMSSPARSRWLEAFNRVCAELSETCQNQKLLRAAGPVVGIIKSMMNHDTIGIKEIYIFITFRIYEGTIWGVMPSHDIRYDEGYCKWFCQALCIRQHHSIVGQIMGVGTCHVKERD